MTDVQYRIRYTKHGRQREIWPSTLDWTRFHLDTLVEQNAAIVAVEQRTVAPGGLLREDDWAPVDLGDAT